MNEIESIQTFTMEMSIKATEDIDNFMFDVMRPYCERVSRHIISKKDLASALVRYFDMLETSDDCISRQAVLEAFNLSEKTRKYGGDHSGYDTMMLYEIQDVIENLPSVQSVSVNEKEIYNKGWQDGAEATAYHIELCIDEGKLISVSENATNGDVIKAMFPEAIISRNGFIVEVEFKAFGFNVEESWWDSPYKRGRQEWQEKK